MKKAISVSVFLLLVLTLFSFALSKESDTYLLTIETSGLRNAKGHVQFTIYNKDGSIPDEDYTKFYRQKNGPILKGKAKVIFKLPKGKYAINILHDENKNGEIDKGWFLPIEGIGFSNFKSIGFSNRPNFSKASFNLNSNTTKVVKVIYM